MAHTYFQPRGGPRIGVGGVVRGVGYRGASLTLEGDAFLRAITTLAFVTVSQTVAMALWLAWRERGEIARVFRVWRVASLVGITSMIGSIGWFFAFTLQTVAYVKALGQIELVFSFFASAFVFKELITRREILGVALLITSIMLLIVALY